MHNAHGPPGVIVVVVEGATMKTTFVVDVAPTVRSPFPIAFAKNVFTLDDGIRTRR
jgi:hypothetical protein